MKKAIPFLILIVVSGAHAQLDSVLWDRSGAGANAWYGVGVYALGDQNDDGFADFMVWGLGQAAPGDSDQAVVELFHGDTVPSATPYMRFTADPATEFRLYDVGVAGDVNGDDYIDWWIMRQTVEDTFTFNLYYGGPDADTIADIEIHRGLSFWIAAGDFNGDGFDEMYCRCGASPCTYSMYYGGSLMDTLPDWELHYPPNEGWAESFGDVNGDGYTDFISNSPPPLLTTYIYFGGVNHDTIPAVTWNSFYSSTSVIVNSLNADGIRDLAFGQPGAMLDIHFGDSVLSTTPNYSLQFQAGCACRDVFSAGDLNNDSYNDLIVIDDACNNLWGTLSLYLGHSWLNEEPVVTIQGRTAPLNLVGIRTAAGLGDVNNDGIDDLAIGAANTNFDGRRGRVVILCGDTSLVVSADNLRPKIPQEFTISIFPNPFNAQTTVNIYIPTRTSQVELQVFNVLGQQIVLKNLLVISNYLKYSLDASDWASGVYLLTVQAGQFRATQKLMLLH